MANYKILVRTLHKTPKTPPPCLWHQLTQKCNQTQRKKKTNTPFKARNSHFWGAPWLPNVHPFPPLAQVTLALRQLSISFDGHVSEAQHHEALQDSWTAQGLLGAAQHQTRLGLSERATLCFHLRPWKRPTWSPEHHVGLYTGHLDSM